MKRPTGAAAGRNVGETGAKSGKKANLGHAARSGELACKSAAFRRKRGTTENRGVPGSSPSLATSGTVCETAAAKHALRVPAGVVVAPAVGVRQVRLVEGGSRR